MKTEPSDSAYPIVIPDGYREAFPGMTKRESFAMAALQGLCANPHAWEELHWHEFGPRAFKIADGAIAAANHPPSVVPVC